MTTIGELYDQINLQQANDLDTIKAVLETMLPMLSPVIFAGEATL